MAEETVQREEEVVGDPSIDHDAHDDPQKGAALGGIGGAVAGAVAGSMAGPIGTLAGALIGGIVGAATSKAAVGAIDKLEHESLESSHPTDHALPAQTAPSDPATNPDVLPIPLPDGASTSVSATEATPDTETMPDDVSR